MKKIYENNRKLINYLIFGVLSTMVCLLTYYLLTISILNPNNFLELQIANTVSWIITIIFVYFTNRKYVFKSKNHNKIKEFSKFILARIITLLLDMIIMGVGVTILFFNDRIIKIISQFIVIVANYLLSKKFIFKKTD